MTNKHFIYAANQIISWCDQNGTYDYRSCPFYEFTVNMFQEFGNNFSESTFSDLIEEKVLS